ncbi:MAG: hypothetical protein AAGC67_04080 [Myxococcota bacterium]
MAISGVERLVQYARDLSVEPSRTPRPADAPAKTGPAREASGDGIKLSLTSTVTGATAPAEAPAAAAPTSYGPYTDAPSERPTAIAARGGNAASAYQRQDAAPLGQKIAIRA